MNKSLIYLSVIFYILFVMQSTAYEFSIPIQSPSNGNLRGPATSANIVYSGGASERVSSNTEDPVTIKKSISPSKKRGYISGERATVFVEIKNNKKNPTFRNITSLSVWEIPDDDLGIIADSAKWMYSSSIVELNDIKMDLLRDDSDSIEQLKKYDNCSNITKYYLLFAIDTSNNLSSNQKKDIIESLYNYFDINWITRDDIIFKNKIDRVLINNSDNDTTEILLNNPKKTILKISDGRAYELRTIEKNGTKYIYDKNSELDFLAKGLEPKGSILFWYDIKPKRAGNFTTDTIIKLYDTDYSDYQDISYPVQVEVKESIPKFEIHPKPNKLLVYNSRSSIPFGKPDKIDVIYDITYLGGASEPICKNITLDFDKPKKDGYFYFIDDKGVRNDSLGDRSSFKNYSNFFKFETKELAMHVAFPNNGIYSLPGIWINGVHYGLEGEKIEITVDNWIQRNKETIGWILAFVGIIIGSIYGHLICKKTKEFFENETHPKIYKLILCMYSLFFLIVIFLLFI